MKYAHIERMGGKKLILFFPVLYRIAMATYKMITVSRRAIRKEKFPTLFICVKCDLTLLPDMHYRVHIASVILPLMVRLVPCASPLIKHPSGQRVPDGPLSRRTVKFNGVGSLCRPALRYRSQRKFLKKKGRRRLAGSEFLVPV